MLWASGNVDSALKVNAAAGADAKTPFQHAQVAEQAAAFALARGHLSDGERLATEAATLNRDVGRAGIALAAALQSVVRTAWYKGDRAGAAKQLDDVLKATPVSAIGAIDRPFIELADAQLMVGRVDAAKATLADFTKAYAAIGTTPDTNTRAHLEGSVALAEKKYDVAAAKFRGRSIDMDFSCGPTCDLAQLARAYDLGGKPDSAIAVYGRYVDDRHLRRYVNDETFLGPSLKRLGELYEAKGDRENAVRQYTRFVDLWKSADPVLQPSVKEAQARLAKLRGGEAGKP